MTEIKVTGLRGILAGLDAFGKRVYKRAAADGLTDTAFLIKKEEERGVPESFDGSVKFTERGFRVNKASFKKTPIEAEVFILPQQAGYLSFQIFGGVRKIGDVGTTKSRRAAVLTPVSARLTKAGNIPQGPVGYLKRSGEGSRRNEFVGQPRGSRFSNAPFGVWKRLGSSKRPSGQKVRLLTAFNEKAVYVGIKFDFFGIADQTFNNDFIKLFRSRLSKEIRKLKDWK